MHRTMKGVYTIFVCFHAKTVKGTTLHNKGGVGFTTLAKTISFAMYFDIPRPLSCCSRLCH